MSLLGSAAAPAASADFDVENDITWHSLFWAEGSSMSGYSDTDAVGTWYNETGEQDATEATNKPTFDTVHASFNDQPVIDFDGTNDILQSNDFTTAPTTPYSIVIVAKYDTASSYLIDGNNGTNRNIVAYRSGGYGIYIGSSWQSSGTLSFVPHLWVATNIDGSTGSETLTVDGTSIVTGDSGSETLDGITIGGRYDAGSFMDGQIALLGIYEGDITADGSYSDFTSWVESHYGITIA